jgi:flagellar basal-body rod modification protein FlgD
MSSILDSTISAAAPTNTDSAAAAPPAMSSADFLQILVAEFQNQDPTSPTDPTQYATQMVDFSDLGQLQSINQDLQGSQTAQTSLMQAASAFIGREVVAPGNGVGVQNDKATAIAYAPTSTDAYTALVSNSTGVQVDQVALGNLTSGSLETFTWKPASSIADGQYQVQIVNSKNVALSGLLEQGIVQSVDMTSSGGVALNLGNLVVSESQVGSVAQASSQN